MDDKCPDIDKYLYIVRQLLDQEASKEDEAFLMQHMEHCKCCLKEYELEQQVRTLLKSKTEKKPLPEGLAEAIKKKIQDIPPNGR